MEKWKKVGIVGSNNFLSLEYEISTEGRLRNKQGTLLSDENTKNGYIINTLTTFKNGKPKLIQVRRDYIVAYTFLKKSSKKFLKHIDENKLNNAKINLQWSMLEKKSYTKKFFNKIILESKQTGIQKIFKTKKSAYEFLQCNKTTFEKMFQNGAFQNKCVAILYDEKTTTEIQNQTIVLQDIEQWFPITTIIRFTHNGGCTKHIIDFTGRNYFVSTEGNLKRGNKLLTNYCPRARIYIENNLTDSNGKPWTIQRHQLVAQTILGSEYFNGASIVHLNNNKLDNSITNLKWQ